MKSDAEDGARLAVVAVGGNLPGRFATVREGLEAAVAALPAAGLEVVRRSRWWRSAAWPAGSEPEFLNAVVLTRTRLSPADALAALFALERRFGRERQQANAPRTLDLDLIAYEAVASSDDDLTLPHPRAHERLFVTGPLAEIAPDWRWPDGRTATDLTRTATVGRDAAPV